MIGRSRREGKEGWDMVLKMTECLVVTDYVANEGEQKLPEIKPYFLSDRSGRLVIYTSWR